MEESHYRLGTAAASEAVIGDLYLKLRRELFEWSRVTFQTPQPRMGYVGQHLTSVVTGYPGSRSGARGKDLILPDGGHAEIKTCYRVDQLGRCRICSSVVSSVEIACAACGSTDIARSDDSKWLISPKHDADMRQLFEPAAYYLVLFDFVDLAVPDTINARIYQVDPKARGFAYCMVDYYFNIKSASISGAPFNLWPFSLKFQLMEPVLIYHSQVDDRDNITTLIFPGEIGVPLPVPIDSFQLFARSRGFTVAMLQALADAFEVALPASIGKAGALDLLEHRRRADGWSNGTIARVLTESMYGAAIDSHRSWLPVDMQ